MSQSRPVRKYNCAQSELYAICNIGWRSYLKYLPEFAAHNTNYTEAYGLAAIAEVDAAQTLPDFQQRDNVSETLRNALGQQSQTAIKCWKTLRSHIVKAYPKPHFKPHIEAAGSYYYNAALRHNWEDLVQLLVSGRTFLTKHNAQLLAAGMPASFPVNYNAVHTQFESTLFQFKNAEQRNIEGTDKKLNANNAIYTKLLSMFSDGQLIFHSQGATRERFIFSRILTLVTLHSSSVHSPAPHP